MSGFLIYFLDCWWKRVNIRWAEGTILCKKILTKNRGRKKGVCLNEEEKVSCLTHKHTTLEKGNLINYSASQTYLSRHFKSNKLCTRVNRKELQQFTTNNKFKDCHRDIIRFHTKHVKYLWQFIYPFSFRLYIYNNKP